jgi:phenylalanyl-tRNA synthetase beta chain
MITNGTDNLCLAGIYGGLESGVSDQTTSVFIEAAYFDPISIRKSARFFGLNTDASFRFERGIDPELVEFAMKRAALLIKEIAGGRISMNPIRIENNIRKATEINFNTIQSNRLLGIHLTDGETESILSELDFKVIEKKDENWILSVPSYRVDVTRACDVSEEILRIYGFNNVPIPEKLNTSITTFPKPDLEKTHNTIADLLVDKGFVEVMNNSLTKSSYYSSNQEDSNSVSILITEIRSSEALLGTVAVIEVVVDDTTVAFVLPK